MILLERNLGLRNIDEMPISALLSYVTLSVLLNIAEVWKLGRGLGGGRRGRFTETKNESLLLQWTSILPAVPVSLKPCARGTEMCIKLWHSLRLVIPSA